MNKAIILLITLFLSLIVLCNTNTKPDRYLDNIVIFKVKPDYRDNFKKDEDFINILSKNSSFDLRQKFPNSKIPETKYNSRGEKLVDLSLIYEIEFRQDADIFGIITNLATVDFIDYAEPLYYNELLYVPDDPLNQTEQYWLDLIQAYDAWDIHKGDTNIVIGIVDTGIDISHEDLIWNIKYNYNDLPNGNDDDGDGYIDNFRGWDFGDNNNNPQAEAHFHGSWVSGIASASTDNGIGLSGVGFKCRFLPIKVMDIAGIIARAYDGVVYAADQGCHVINCSWGNTTYQQMAQDVINYATYNRDALVIGACGNNNNEVLFYPASYENVISVAGTTIDDTKWGNTETTSGSSFGPLVDISAPSTMMLTTGDGDYFMTHAGTSFAAPVVAGAAAILRSYYPEFSALQIGELLKIGADNIDTIPENVLYAGKLGTGRVNMYNSLTMEHTPSVVLKNIDISDERAINDVVYINGDFINYLAPTTNLQVSISTESPTIHVINSTLEIGELNTLEPLSTSNFIKFSVLPGTPYDYLVYIKLEYSDGDYYAVQNIPVVVNYSYKDITTEKLRLSIVANGRFGYSDRYSNIGNGFRYNEIYRLFYDSGIICGNSSNKVFSSVRQVPDFKTIKYPEEIEFSEIADNEVVTEFSDEYSNNPLEVEVIQTAYSWDDTEFANFILVEFELINRSMNDINSYYFGIFNDWDLITPSNNSVHYNSEKQIMYCQNNGTQTMYAGLKLLSEQNGNNYGLAQINGGDGFVDITNGLSDAEKFHVISNSNTGVGSSGEGYDVVIISSAGPFDIPANDTVKVAFAFVVAESLFTLLESVDEASEIYKQNFIGSNIEDSINDFFSIFPNPAENTIIINRGKKYSSTEITVDIFDLTGKLVFKEKFPVDNNQIIININNLSQGFYTVSIESEYGKESQKILKIK